MSYIKGCKPSLHLLFAAILSFSLCALPLSSVACFADEPQLSYAEAAILIDADSMTALYQRNADKALPMASTTKIMTALTALSYISPESKLTVPYEAVGIEGSSASLCEGEVYTLYELLVALLLQSANDAAAAIAINIGGSIDSFAALMNHKAASLGLTNTHFANPHGLPDETHYTTARELAVISAYALKNECISEITATKSAKIQSEGGKTHYFTNHNKLLSSYDGADGVKTGYTKASGRCLVSSATRQGLRLIAVTLHSHDDWNEHTRMLDWGFDNYEAIPASKLGGLSFVIPLVSESGTFVCASAPERYITVKKGELSDISVTNEYPRFLYSPLTQSKAIGRIVYRYKGEVIATSPIYPEGRIDIS